MCTTKQALEKKKKKETHLQEWVMRRLWACNAHMDIQCMKRECMYACTDYDLLIMYKCVKFCEINIHSIGLKMAWGLFQHKDAILPVHRNYHYRDWCHGHLIFIHKDKMAMRPISVMGPSILGKMVFILKQSLVSATCWQLYWVLVPCWLMMAVRVWCLWVSV